MIDLKAVKGMFKDLLIVIKYLSLFIIINMILQYGIEYFDIYHFKHYNDYKEPYNIFMQWIIIDCLILIPIGLLRIWYVVNKNNDKL
jgi:hypothetical protein